MTAVQTIAITAIRPTGFRHLEEPAVHLPIPAHSPTGTVTKTQTVNPVLYVVTTIARIFTLEQVTKTTAVFTLMEAVPTMEKQVIAPVYGVTPIQAVKQMEIPSYPDVRRILVSGVARNIGPVLWEEETAAVMMTARKV